ncbi:hypothetical protein OUZ56_002856 [Daphnia magna]|uniref:Uncharacterized protein n=1 Tax=Daphnia magna TaxID=35525 RepID=A0ABR0A6Z8_9CRUS|nr:hypothetical protein OUZ56_002856 [Daphnia magna]
MPVHRGFLGEDWGEDLVICQRFHQVTQKVNQHPTICHAVAFFPVFYPYDTLLNKTARGMGALVLVEKMDYPQKPFKKSSETAAPFFF